MDQSKRTHNQASEMSSASRFPERPIIVTMSLPVNAFRLIVACLRRTIDADPAVLNWQQIVQARELVEAISAVIPKGDRGTRAG